MGLHHGYHPEYFFNGYDLGQLCERLLLKESYATIYWVLGNFLGKIIFRKLYVLKFQMIVMRLPLRQPLGAEL